ncbi:hypothetical protein ABEB36_000068 [Hypothenemus hampei]|uniref:DUF7869 domain-containing protein n=1 Tax=Hypothenemus hampei TaxID=57062 RepID=A0ABD1FA51_HYPHA
MAEQTEVGQNKNHTVVRFLMNFTDSGRFDTIKHYFPIRGHSFLPCDRDFECIKRKIRKMDRIYTLDEYVQLILDSSRTGRFSVEKVETNNILSFKSWWPKKYKKSGAYPAGRVPINGKKLDDLRTLSNYVVGYDFYSVLQKLPRTQTQANSVIQNLNEDSDGENETEGRYSGHC